MSYDAFTIAKELNATALGEAYYGNALYVARDFPCVTHNDRLCLNRWLNGNQSSMDHVRLQDIANMIIREHSIDEYYKDRTNSGQSPLNAHR